MHILWVCTKYGYSLDSLQHLFHSLIIPLFTYGISVWGVANYERYLSKIDKFQKRTVRFGFLKEATLILRAPVRKNQTYRGTGGKFDFFHILMLDRLGYNYNHCMCFLVKYPLISEINANIQIHWNRHLRRSIFPWVWKPRVQKPFPLPSFKHHSLLLQLLNIC